MKVIGVGLLSLIPGCLILYLITDLVISGGDLFGSAANEGTSRMNDFTHIYIFPLIWVFILRKQGALSLSGWIMGVISLALLVLALVFVESFDASIIGVFQAGNIAISCVAIYLNHKLKYHILVQYGIICMVFLFGLLLPVLYLGALATTGVSKEGMDLFCLLSRELKPASNLLFVVFGAIYGLTNLVPEQSDTP